MCLFISEIEKRNSKEIEERLFSSNMANTDRPWQADGLCVETDYDVFFPTQNTTTIRYAKRVCDLCSVQVDCLNFALKKNIRCGVWGGLTENERRRIKKNRSKKNSGELQDNISITASAKNDNFAEEKQSEYSDKYDYDYEYEENKIAGS